MMTGHELDAFGEALIAARKDSTDLDRLGPTDRAAVVAWLIERPDGRRWLRTSPLLDVDMAHSLLGYADDFRQRRPDRSLEPVIQLANADRLVAHAPSIAAGSAAPALWSHLRGNPNAISRAVDAIIASADPAAIEATATHLLLDRANPYGIGGQQRAAIASEILDSGVESARGVAAEFLATFNPERLALHIDAFARDDSPRVRGFSWLAAFRTDPDRAIDRALALLGDESLDPSIRRSALNAAGEAMPTDAVVELLAYFVTHPSRQLALEASDLLLLHHRRPEIAIAAASSPHEEVRETARMLMDPYRGSPAAGGSRPGDPLRTDPLFKIIQQLEDGETRE